VTIDLLEQPGTQTEPKAVHRWPFSVSVVVPAFNEGPRAGGIVRAIRAQLPEAEIIVVDDASRDDTTAQAAAAGAHVITRPYNVGNGAGVKTGVRAATGDVVVVIDADGQHDPADIPRLLDLIGPYDLVIAARPGRESHENWLRWAGNALINRFGSYLMEMEMKDLTSGFRAFRREVLLEFIHLLPNRFSWPTTSALAFTRAGYHVRFEPIAMHRRQGGQSTQKLFKNGVRFVLIMLRMTSLFAPMRVYFPVAIAMFALSLLAYVASVLVNGVWLKIPNATAALFVGGIVVFMFGLLAEQIAGLRFQRRDE
jgi:glycosyltransferase involved in cell wall biosynthesis